VSWQVVTLAELSVHEALPTAPGTVAVLRRCVPFSSAFSSEESPPPPSVRAVAARRGLPGATALAYTRWLPARVDAHARQSHQLRRPFTTPSSAGESWSMRRFLPPSGTSWCSPSCEEGREGMAQQWQAGAPVGEMAGVV